MKKSTPRHPYKIKACEVCGRDYKAFPSAGKNGGVTYRGECPYCHSFDYSRDGKRGHLELEYDWVEGD